MTRNVHLVGSVGLDSGTESMATAGKLLGSHLKRLPDGEPGGRRLWISWQYPLLRSYDFLDLAEEKASGVRSGFITLKLADGVKPDEIQFGELGYAREARGSYAEFLEMRKAGNIPKGVRFQVCLPTPMAVIGAFCTPETAQVVGPAYEQAMLREIGRICSAIPHKDLALQWDICIEMVMWDGRWAPMTPFPGFQQVLAGALARQSAAVPADVELGYHLCYGDWKAKHFIEPEDATKMTELANFIFENVKRPIAWMHVPVPIERNDDAFFAPLTELKLPSGTELYLGLVHGKDGAEGTKKRVATAKKYVKDFGIATECGIARARSPEIVKNILKVHADVAGTT